MKQTGSAARGLVHSGWTGAGVALWVSLACMHVQAATPYRRVGELVAVPNAAYNVALDVQSMGQAAGYASTKTGETTRYYFNGIKFIAVKEPVLRRDAVVWNTQGQPILQPALTSGGTANAWAMNDAGSATGDSTTLFDKSGVAVVWRGGKAIDLGAGSRSSGRAINASGWVLGAKSQTSSISSPKDHFLAKDKASLKWLKPVPAGVDSLYCTGLSDAGQVLCRGDGISSAGDLVFRAFLWTGTTFTELVAPEAGNLVYLQMTPAGSVAGVLQRAGGLTKLFQWQAGTWRFLPDPPLPADVISSVVDANDRGEMIVSAWSTATRESGKYLWTGREHVAVRSLITDLAAGESLLSVKLGPEGQLLVTITSTINGQIRDRQAIYAP